MSDFAKLPLTLVTSFETPSMEPELPPKDHLPKHGTTRHTGIPEIEGCRKVFGVEMNIFGD